MKNHTKIYLDWFGFGTDDFIPCEICQAKAVDIHHIESRGMGGTTTPDVIENLMALCRPCHHDNGDRIELVPALKLIHQLHMDNRDQLVAGLMSAPI